VLLKVSSTTTKRPTGNANEHGDENGREKRTVALDCEASDSGTLGKVSN
jgi:hypothetical protein